MIKCAWCNSDQLCTENEKPPAYTFRKCPECGKQNAFRAIVEQDGDVTRTSIMSEMVSSTVPQGEGNVPLDWSERLADRASDAAVGRAITKIIKGDKK